MSRFARLSALVCLVFSLVAPPAHAQAGDVPPTEAAALLTWLQSGAYKAWPKESAPHRSMGAHQTLVLTYISPALDKSLGGKAPTHPKGAAAVKELLDAGGKLTGWAVSVKTSADSDGGKGWFWYEILGTTAGSQMVANGPGVPLCVGCHARGRDAVLTEHPLD
jgi:hypothetical protein